MENLRRHFSKKKDTGSSVIGRVKRNGNCKKHPKHQQSPGVCSLCLREKLTQLSSSNSCGRISAIITAGSSSSSFSSLSSTYYSSASASSCASPVHCFCFTTEGKSSSSVSIFLLNGNHGIIKSRCRSLDIVPRRDCEGGADHGHNKSPYKSGFWFKLLHPKSKRMKEYYGEDTKMVHSMSIKIRETMA